MSLGLTTVERHSDGQGHSAKVLGRGRWGASRGGQVLPQNLPGTTWLARGWCAVGPV